MRFDPGATLRMRQLATNEDAACAIMLGWAAGSLGDAKAWVAWLAQHNVHRERAWELRGFQAPASLGVLPIFGAPTAVSEYRRESEQTTWVECADGILGIMTAPEGTVYWYVRDSEAIPTVRISGDPRQNLAVNPTGPKSRCCNAPVEVSAPDLRSTGFSDENLTQAIRKVVRCRQCQADITGQVEL